MTKPKTYVSEHGNWKKGKRIAIHAWLITHQSRPLKKLPDVLSKITHPQNHYLPIQILTQPHNSSEKALVGEILP